MFMSHGNAAWKKSFITFLSENPGCGKDCSRQLHSVCVGVIFLDALQVDKSNRLLFSGSGLLTSETDRHSGIYDVGRLPETQRQRERFAPVAEDTGHSVSSHPINDSS